MLTIRHVVERTLRKGMGNLRSSDIQKTIVKTTQRR